MLWERRLPVTVTIKGFKETFWTDPGSLKKSWGTVCSEHNQSTSTALERAVISLLSGGCFTCQRAWCDKLWRVWTYSQTGKDQLSEHSSAQCYQTIKHLWIFLASAWDIICLQILFLRLKTSLNSTCYNLECMRGTRCISMCFFTLNIVVWLQLYPQADSEYSFSSVCNYFGFCTLICEMSWIHLL